MSSESLNVIALISGGKDSFFSILHCLQNGHRVVALANLFPPEAERLHSTETQFIDPLVEPNISSPSQGTQDEEDGPIEDLNSFMYQTVGHEIIPLYAAATGLPLYRQAIAGGATKHERDYAYDAEIENADETEFMIPLLLEAKRRHPEANAVCSGAILSTYQRTRVESVALRLNLIPLSYLWKYTVLPSPVTPINESQLLVDMAAAGLEARIIKVASAGLDESFLWDIVSSDAGSERVKRALKKFGISDGAALGEGGEFESLVVRGPPTLFKRAISVPANGKKLIHEGGGSTWLMLRGAQLEEDNASDPNDTNIRQPQLLDDTFKQIWNQITESNHSGNEHIKSGIFNAPNRPPQILQQVNDLLHFTFVADAVNGAVSIEDEMKCLASKIRNELTKATLELSNTTSVIIVLRNMADFSKVNGEYGKLYTKPNPPSRVTISCGSLLPDRRNIMIYITIPQSKDQSYRDGLHVQSRSYWAPANIGPYSQAIEIPVLHGVTNIRATYIAGQIPLIPSSMTLPPPSPSSLHCQITLSLQHLWRIGTERSVQHWTSAVAYFAKSSSSIQMQTNSKLAGRAWDLIHAAPDEDEDEEEESTGPDLWDLKYNPKYMSLANTAQSTVKRTLPDFSIFSLRQQNEPASCIPPFFAVEVEELPRQSAVEWHAHIGLSGVEEGRSEMIQQLVSGDYGLTVWHTILRDSGCVCVYSTVSASRLEGSPNPIPLLNEAYQNSMTSLNLTAGNHTDTKTPYLMYVDSNDSAASWQNWDFNTAIIPCHSIWTANGEQIAAIALFKQIFMISNDV